MFIGAAWANQPRMQAALSDLQDARTQLREATTNKAGHRVRALRFVNDAIREIRAGIAAAD